jgi:hypothetical protein
VLNPDIVVLALALTPATLHMVAPADRESLFVVAGEA